MDEAEWYERIYRGDEVPQLTVRAVLMGAALGFLLAFTNLYIGLLTGWSLGVAITACIVAFALWNVLLKAGIAKKPMTILETNCMQSTASAAGFATGGILISAFPALLLLSVNEQHPEGVHLPWQLTGAWIFFMAALGTILAIPMKRNMINRERLRFPSGTAAAVTLQSLYSEGTAALRKARALMYAALAGGVVPLLIDLKLVKERVVDACSGAVTIAHHSLLPSSSRVFDLLHLPARGVHDAHVTEGCVEVTRVVTNKPSDWTMLLDHNPVMIAAGMLIGLRVTIYMTLGSLVLIYGVGPHAYDWVWTASASAEPLRAATEPWNAWREIGVWLGVPIMVSYGLLSFAMQWRTIGRAVRGLLRRDGAQVDERVRRTEVPASWFAWGTLLSGAGAVALAHAYFDVPWHYGALAVALTFFLALVACRAMGETDIAPIGAMGKITQLTYGVLIPQSTTANLMTASVTASSASASADLLNDLKSGYLLGANPRRQFLAQFLGIFSGTVAMTFGYYLLVPGASALDGDPYPAPAAQSWKAVAEVFRTGLENMHPMHQQAIAWGLALGAIMLVLERILPKARPWLPSATGIGLGLILPFQYPFSMLIGAIIAAVWSRKRKAHAEAYLVPVAAGVIAGVSLIGVIVAVVNNLLLS